MTVAHGFFKSPRSRGEIRCREIREIECQFIILARKDEPTPDFVGARLLGEKSRYLGDRQVEIYPGLSFPTSVI